MDWHTAGRYWLEKEALVEYRAQLASHKKRGRSPKTFRYVVPDWQRDAIDALNKNDEERFKAIKLARIGLPPLKENPMRPMLPPPRKAPMKPWQVAGLVGVGALGLVYLASFFFGKKASAATSTVPQAHTGTWKRLELSGTTYHLEAGQIYALAGAVTGVDPEALKTNFGAIGLRVLDVSTSPPDGFPATDIAQGFTYAVFTPEKDTDLPVPSGGARILVLR